MIQATVLGAVALHVRNTAGGRDPEPTFSDKSPFFWVKAAMRARLGAGLRSGNRAGEIIASLA